MADRILAASAGGDHEAVLALVEEAAEASERDGEPDGYLDKSWDALPHLLYRAGISIDFVYDGDPVGFDDLIASVWSPDEVRAAVAAMREVPPERLAEHFDPADMAAHGHSSWTDDEDLADLQGYYVQLVGFLEHAAASGSAVLVSFG